MRNCIIVSFLFWTGHNIFSNQAFYSKYFCMSICFKKGIQRKIQLISTIKFAQYPNIYILKTPQAIPTLNFPTEFNFSRNFRSFGQSLRRKLHIRFVSGDGFIFKTSGRQTRWGYETFSRQNAKRFRNCDGGPSPKFRWRSGDDPKNDRSGFKRKLRIGFIKFRSRPWQIHKRYKNTNVIQLYIHVIHTL